MHFTYHAKSLEKSILDGAQIDPRIRNYTTSSMSSCGLLTATPINAGSVGQGGWIPGGMGVGPPGAGGPNPPGTMGFKAPGNMGSAAPVAPVAPAAPVPPAPGVMGQVAQWGLGQFGPPAPGFGGTVRARGSLPCNLLFETTNN